MTISIPEQIHRALQLKAAATSRTIPEIVSDAVRRDLAEDAEDLAAFEARGGEPPVPLEEVVRALHKPNR